MHNWISAICLALCATGCCPKKDASSEGKLQVLRLNIHSDPPTLDARRARDTSSISVIRLCFEGLLKPRPGAPPEFALAERVEESPDKTLYTFYLRPALWWDGEKITAYDFESTWKTVLSPAFPSGFANDLFVIKNAAAVKEGRLPMEQVGIKALSESVLEVRLEHPAPYFLDLVASHAFVAVPKHIVENCSNWTTEHFVGNGPFKLVEWRHHNQIIFKKNELYWDKDNVKIQEIRLAIVSDETTELNMFESGELDWAGNPFSHLPIDAIQALTKEKRLHTYPLLGTYSYIFNVKQPPFDNLNLRKAFSFAINRQEIIENITQSGQELATGLVPPLMWKTRSPPLFADHDCAEAKRLFELALKEMGYTRETLPPITLTFNALWAHQKIAQAIQEQWFRVFGIRVQLKQLEWKVFLDAMAHKQYQVARMGGVASFKDPLSFLDIYRYDLSHNFTGWTNPKFTALLDEADQTTDLGEREKLLHQAEEIFISEMPMAPIYYYRGAYIKKPHLHSVDLSELDEANFKFAYVETR